MPLLRGRTRGHGRLERYQRLNSIDTVRQKNDADA